MKPPFLHYRFLQFCPCFVFINIVLLIDVSIFIIHNILTHCQPLSQVALVKQAASKVTDCVTKIATEHRSLFTSTVKMARRLRKLSCSIFEGHISYFLLCKRDSGEVETFVSLRQVPFFRELHSSVSKVGKAVDRNFVADFDSTAREEVCKSY